MKKLMIAAIAIAFVFVANAAQVKWNTTYEIADGIETGITSATIAYLIDASVLTQATIYDAVASGKTLAEAIGDNSVRSATLSSGKITLQDFDVSASGNKTYYMALFDSDLNAVYFSEQLTKTLLDTGAATYAFTSDSSIEAIAASMDGFSASAGGWVGTSAVPEPTSGLLMLLGIAGLALKRKRA